jgi:hypothetical protein
MEILPELEEEVAGALIMTARAPWFEEETEEAEGVEEAEE